MKKYYDRNLELTNFPSLDVYQTYLNQYCNLSEVRRIYMKVLNVTTDELPVAFDKKSFYIRDLIDYYFYNDRLF